MKREAKLTDRKLLAQTPLFSRLGAEQLDVLVEASRLLDVPAQHFLFYAGEPIRHAYLLIDGTLQRSTTVAGTTEKIIELVQTRQMLGLGEIFGATRYASSAKALTPCTVVAINIRKLHALIRQDLDLSWRIIQAMAARQCAVEFDVTGYHHGLTGTQRVFDYLLEQAGGQPGLAGESAIRLSTSKKIIASRIGMTPESFSRSLRQLSERGAIVVEGRTVYIQNAALLNTHSGDEKALLSFPRRPKSPGGHAGKGMAVGALINLCGRLRLLSQRMAIAWLLAAGNIAPLRARVKLRQFEAEFTRSLARLSGVGLPVGLDERLVAVAEVWPRYRQALFALEPDAAQAPAVLDLSEEILQSTDRLTCFAEDLASRPEAHYVNVAGRNRMLSQQLAKFFLFGECGLGEEIIAPRIEETRLKFEGNLHELQQGGMPFPELQAQLQEVAGQWSKLQGALQQAPRPANKGRHVVAVVGAAERLLRHVDTAVKLYERLAV